MGYTPYHSFSDRELITYVLPHVNHPAVDELCRRLEFIDSDLAEYVDVKEELRIANETIDELNVKISDLQEENYEDINYIESLELDIKTLNATVS